MVPPALQDQILSAIPGATQLRKMQNVKSFQNFILCYSCWLSCFWIQDFKKKSIMFMTGEEGWTWGICSIRNLPPSGTFFLFLLKYFSYIFSCSRVLISFRARPVFADPGMFANQPEMCIFQSFVTMDTTCTREHAYLDLKNISCMTCSQTHTVYSSKVDRSYAMQ